MTITRALVPEHGRDPLREARATSSIWSNVMVQIG
jgi:hypothetical protein